KYKGLDILLEAMKIVSSTPNAERRTQNAERLIQNAVPIAIGSGTPKLLVAGEFYEDAKPYHEQIKQLGIQDSLILRTDFIPDSEVKYYLCAADAVVQPYRSATQSGVTPLAYHFQKPMVVTNVGGLPALVPNLKCGIVCEPQPESIAEAILKFYQLGEAFFIPNLQAERAKYSWSHLVQAIKTLAATASNEVPHA